MTRRVLTLADEESAVQARLVVERDGVGPSRILDVHVTSTNGRGLRAEDLLLLGDMGLRLPVPVVEPPTAAEAGPVSAPVEPSVAPVRPPAKAAAKTTAKPRRKRSAYRQSPPVEELDRLYRQCGGSPSGMARQLDVPRHTVQSWIRRHTAAGFVFTFAPESVAAGEG